jgi:hypothetical protein
MEPLLRMQVTSGLATWPTQPGARLRGLLEVIERDAFFLTWLNQLVVPRLDIASYEPLSPSLRTILGWFRQYRFDCAVLPLVTDAPTHAVAVVLTDTLSATPRRTVGLAAGAQLLIAIEHAALEALRGQLSARQYELRGESWESGRAVSSIGHADRLLYWSHKEHEPILAAFASGPLRTVDTTVPWWNESDDAHFARLCAWCAHKGYEPVTLSLGGSRHNPTPWAIEMVAIPELYPIYITEQYQHHADGGRLTKIPQELGYTPRPVPYFAAPHPFY